MCSEKDRRLLQRRRPQRLQRPGSRPPLWLADTTTKRRARKSPTTSSRTLCRNAVLLYDKVRRRALQPHFGAAQIGAQQRSRRRALLARPHARSRRRSSLRRAPRRPHGRGRHRPRRSQCACSLHGCPRCRRLSSACPKAISRWRRPSSICRVAPKSNALYTAYGAVQGDVEHTAAEPVPLHLRNAPTGLMKGLGYGNGYQYAHDLEGKVADMQCLPDNLAAALLPSHQRRGGKAHSRAAGRDQTAALPEGCLPSSENRIRRLNRRI